MSSVKTKCRFCPSEPMTLRDLRAHVAKEHTAEAARIESSLPLKPQGDGRDYGPRQAGVGQEFRRRLGYGPSAGGAPVKPDEE